MEYKEDNIEPHIEKIYECIQKIGSGAYGYVWKVRQKSTDQIFALKKIFLAFQNDVDAQRTYRQISILRQINHPNIIKLKDIIKANNNLDLYLVFEYVECDLFNAIRDGVLNEVHKKYIIFQLARGLYYLHSAGILHRDLKPSNILIDANCKIKICDFGLSRTMYNYDNQEPYMTQFIATRWYRAPQVLFGSRKYSYKSDMWSLGCLIYQMFAIRPLLPGNDSVNQIEKVLELKGFPNQQQIQELKVEKLDVLLSHFKIEQYPEQNFFKPSWDAKLVQLIKHLLQYSPKKRWGTQQVMNCQFIEQFHKYQELLSAKMPVILRVSDNVKNDKEFYRNFINKFFVKKFREFQRPLIRLPNRSTTPSKRGVETSLRNNKIKNSSTSLYNSKKFLDKSLGKDSQAGKKVSKTIHCTVRNKSSQSKYRRKKADLSVSKFMNQSKTKSRQYRESLKQKQNKENINITRKKSGHRKLQKDISRSIIKEENNKKVLKRRALVYNI